METESGTSKRKLQAENIHCIAVIISKYFWKLFWNSSVGKQNDLIESEILVLEKREKVGRYYN